MDILEKLDTYITEGMKPADKKKVQDIMTKFEFMDLREPLKKAGFKVDFAYSPVAHYTVKKGNDKVVILNKKYADGPDFVYKDIAMGEM